MFNKPQLKPKHRKTFLFAYVNSRPVRHLNVCRQVVCAVNCQYKVIKVTNILQRLHFITNSFCLYNSLSNMQITTANRACCCQISNSCTQLSHQRTCPRAGKPSRACRYRKTQATSQQSFGAATSAAAAAAAVFSKLQGFCVCSDEMFTATRNLKHDILVPNIFTLSVWTIKNRNTICKQKLHERKLYNISVDDTALKILASKFLVLQK